MRAEQTYIDLFTHYEDQIRKFSSDVMNVPRTKAFRDFERLGFPKLGSEDYTHTDVAKAFTPEYGVNVNRLAIPVNPASVFRCNVQNMSTQIYSMLNDQYYDKLSNNHLPEGLFVGSLNTFAEKYPDVAAKYYGKLASTEEDCITALNTMLAQDGFVIYVQKGVKLANPLQLVNLYRSDVDLMVNRRVLIILEPDTEARLLVCDHCVDDVKFLATQVVEIFAEENSFFDYYDLEETTTSTSRFSSMYVEQETSSNVLVNGITLCNGLTRNNYQINLRGEHAESTLCGMTVADQDELVDNFTRINHYAPNCHSDQTFKYVLNGHSTGVFCGRILVAEGAQKTRAYQSSRNLCGTPQARMYGKPQLEIYADDVKCSHGMTTGQLDENALFYMQTRGIPLEEARMMLSIAFTSEIIDYVRLEPLRERLQQLMEKRFRGELARCADCGVC